MPDLAASKVAVRVHPALWKALKLACDPAVRTALAEAPEQVEAVRNLIQQAGLAA